MAVLILISWAFVVVLIILYGYLALVIFLATEFFIQKQKTRVEHLTIFSPMQLVDFESWKMVFSKSEKNSGYITSGGPFHGYLDSLEQRHMDVQGNTYAFGVLLLELISGRPPYCKDRGYLVDWVRQLSVCAI